MAQKKKKGNHDIVYGLQKHFKPCTGGTRIFNKVWYGMNDMIHCGT